ncbi:hypothetical protein [Xanthomonas citri]|uniref:hypothetical protein n=1 Tax=Xanthomonas citri TaxID=346 RepID=UPI000537FAAF|nr:hypothetical protein [Xanthomonas citri]ATB57661.1 hypothetical protein CKU38_01153 [Xanthomonas citri pv. fuscans]KGU48569.1 hypothetical protein NY97_05750 [Xanthomonas citri pv. fuscans]QWN11150.1 hypothetical protein DGN07_05750 [Xanthomonas citri pv. fuscans]
MKTGDVIARASKHLSGLRGHEFDVLEVAKPVSPNAAVNLAKIVSKLSPLVGNLIEFNTCEYLNQFPEFNGLGHWYRQDPGFPDTVFIGSVSPTPGFEIKAWFPLATEITARFKDSQKHFTNNNTYVAMLAWLPEFLIFGKPHVVDIVVVSGASVAKARDAHYHKPPDYLVIEPNDTAARTVNLQQTTTSGYKFQGTETELAEAKKLVASWGPRGRVYSPAHDYQTLLAQLMARFPYRLDTNFAKMDRIVHSEIEAFKRRTYGTTLHGRTIGDWNRLLSRGGEAAVALALADTFGIREGSCESVVEP